MRVHGIGCIVTGASRGIGEAVALELAARRCRVGLLARDAVALERVAAACSRAGGEALPMPVDLTDGPALEAAVLAAGDWAGTVRLVVVNAGLGVHGAAEAVTAEDTERVMRLNFQAAVETVRATLPLLRSGAPSSLVALSSLAALIPFRGGAVYGASKGAFITYLRCLRLELAGSPIRVAWVCPGPVRTGMLEDVPPAKLPRLSRWLVPILEPRAVSRAVVRSAEGGRAQRVIPTPAAFFASFARHLPRLAERVELLTGAGET